MSVLAILGLAIDARMFGSRVPGPRRQVDENWLATYRGWVYGAGFGAQLGVAFATIVTASATWIAFACAFVRGVAARWGDHRRRVRHRASAADPLDAHDVAMRATCAYSWRGSRGGGRASAVVTTVAQAIAACALVVSVR